MISFPAVFCPAVGDQRAEEQQGHPGRRGHAQGMPPQADHDACGGGELGSPDEPVPGAGDPEVRGGRPHLGLAGQLAGRGEQAGRGQQQQRDGDEPGNLLARLRLIPSSSPLTWSFPLAFTILGALTHGPAVTLADRRPRCAEVPVRLRTGRGTPKWLVRALPADCGAGVHDATPHENSGQVSCQSLRDRGALARTSGRPAADRRAPGGLAREPVPDTRARHCPGRTRAAAAAGTGFLPRR